MSKILLLHFNYMIRDGLFTWPDMQKSEWKPNYGDILVSAALIRMLRAKEQTTTASFGSIISGNPDLALMRGSTYLHNDFDFGKAVQTLESIKAPVACVGLGAQSPVQDVAFLDGNAGAKRFVALLAERSKSISVRGRFTAAVLERLGAKNIRLTGCPSLFYTGAPKPVAISGSLETPYRRIGVSIHSGLVRNVFCRDPERTRRRHADVIEDMARLPNGPRIFEQGNYTEFLISSHAVEYGERIRAAARFIAALGLEGLTPEQLASYFVSVRSVEEWLGKARDLDALVGFRFHGNMVGLAQGIPCFYYCYDSRIKEFCELYELPHHDIEDDYRDPVPLMMDHDWDRANAAMLGCFEELKTFFRENAVPVVETLA